MTKELEVQVRPTSTHKEAQELEQRLVDEFKGTGYLCNVAVLDVTKPALGSSNPLSAEHKEAISKANKNKVMTSLTKERISSVKKEFYKTEEGRQALATIHASRSTPITINEVAYPSIKAAARALSVHPRKLAIYKP